MVTKYAAARDVAYQWRAEHRKVSRENKSLRQVYACATELLQAIEGMPLSVDAADIRSRLKSACRNAVFAAPTPPPKGSGG